MQQSQMENSHDHSSRLSGWKRLVLVSVSVGAAFGLVFGAILVGYNTYKTRALESKPWNSQAMVASFDGN